MRDSHPDRGDLVDDCPARYRRGTRAFVSAEDFRATTAPAGSRFDPIAATEVYLAKMSPEQVAKSDSYFEGGYWLRLWNYLLSAALSLILLTTGLSARMRSAAERLLNFHVPPLQTLIYGTVLPVHDDPEFPPFALRKLLQGAEVRIDEPDARGLVERAGDGNGHRSGDRRLCHHDPVCDLASRTKVVVDLGVGRVRGNAVPADGAGPRLHCPHFQQVHDSRNPKIRDPILSLARANEIPAEHVYVFDASKQTKRVSANVSGALGTMRISLNDNLLNRCSLASVRAVMAHEMGHYVLNHVYKGLLEMGLLLTVGFAFCAWAFDRIVARRGAAWGIRSIGDPAGLPLIALLLSTYMFVMTPVSNSITARKRSKPMPSA